MADRTASISIAASLLVAHCISAIPARADNAMGYRLLPAEQASGLPHNRGALGMDIESAQEINSGGMTFDLIRVKQVRPASAGAQAGLAKGDEIIAVDGLVFPNMRAFADYIGSKPPGARIVVDYIPSGGGPDQAQRVSATVGGGGSASSAGAQTSAPAPTGMSTRTKIGLAAAALLGCYELGCFSSKASPGVPGPQQPRPAP